MSINGRYGWVTGARSSGSGLSAAAGRGSAVPRPASAPPFAAASRPGASQESSRQQRPLSAQARAAGGGSLAAGSHQLQHSSTATRAADRLSGVLNANPEGLDDITFGRAFDFVQVLYTCPVFSSCDLVPMNLSWLLSCRTLVSQAYRGAIVSCEYICFAHLSSFCG